MENFTIFKNTYKEKDNQPDYKVSVKDGEGYKEWGACWKKEGKSGSYLSCAKSKSDGKSHLETKDDAFEGEF